MSKVAVLIPCYNEAQTIRKVVEDYRTTLGTDATVYVYDNNSADDSAAIAREAGAVVRFEHVQGKANVMRRMFREIDADCYVMVDGDDTYPPDDVPRMIDMVLNQGYDLVLGDRLSSSYFSENKRAMHGFGNRLVRFLVNGFFDGKLTDIMTGLRVMSRPFVKTLPLLSNAFEIETEMSVHALHHSFAVASVPIEYRDRPTGSVSKLHTVRDGFKVLFSICKMLCDYKPIFFSSICATLLMVLSMLCIVVLRRLWWVNRLLAVVTIIVSLILFFMATTIFCNGFVMAHTERARRREFFCTLAQTNPKAEETSKHE